MHEKHNNNQLQETAADKAAFETMKQKNEKKTSRRGKFFSLLGLFGLGVGSLSAQDKLPDATQTADTEFLNAQANIPTQVMEAPDNIEPDPNQASMEDVQRFEKEKAVEASVESTAEGSSLDLGTYFTLNSPEMTDADAVEAQDALLDFVTKLSPEELKNLKVKVSCDPQSTIREGGNPKLAADRFMTFNEKVLKPVFFDRLNLSEMGIDPTSAQNFFDTEIEIDIPKSGTAPITDFVNHKTGENFKDMNEFNNLTAQEKQEHYPDMRYVKVVIEDPNDADRNMEASAHVSITEYTDFSDPELLQDIFGHKGTVKILTDNTGSVQFDELENLLVAAGKSGFDVRGTEVTPIDHELHMEWSQTVRSAQDLKQMAEKFQAYPSADIEDLLGDNTLQKRLHSMPSAAENPDNVIAIPTDEIIQARVGDVIDADKLALEKGTTVKILVKDVQGIHAVSLGDLAEIVEQMPELNDINGPIGFGFGPEPYLEGRSAVAKYVDLYEVTGQIPPGTLAGDL